MFFVFWSGQLDEWDVYLGDLLRDGGVGNCFFHKKMVMFGYMLVVWCERRLLGCRHVSEVEVVRGVACPCLLLWVWSHTLDRSKGRRICFEATPVGKILCVPHPFRPASHVIWDC